MRTTCLRSASVVSLMALMACAKEHALDSDESDLEGAPLAGLAAEKIGEGAGAGSFVAISDDTAVWGAFPTTDGCQEGSFAVVSAKDKATTIVLPKGGWRSARISPSNDFIVAIGAVGKSCVDGLPSRDLYIASIAAPKAVTDGLAPSAIAADFDFLKNELLLLDAGTLRGVSLANGEEKWKSAIEGDGIPRHAVDPSGVGFVYTSTSAKIVLGGKVQDVKDFPGAAKIENRLPAAAIASSGRIVLQKPTAKGYELFTITPKDDGVEVTNPVKDMRGRAVLSKDFGRGFYAAPSAADPARTQLFATDLTGAGTAFDGLSDVALVHTNVERQLLTVTGLNKDAKRVIATISMAKDTSATVVAEAPGTGHKGVVTADGKRLVFTAKVEDNGGEIRRLYTVDLTAPGEAKQVVKDAADGDLLHGFELEAGSSPSAVLATYDKRAVMVSFDGKRSLELPGFEGFLAWQKGVLFYQRSNRLALGAVTSDGLEERQDFMPDAPAVMGGAFSPSGKTLFVAAATGTFRVDMAKMPGTGTNPSPDPGTGTNPSPDPGTEPGTGTGTGTGTETGTGSESAVSEEDEGYGPRFQPTGPSRGSYENEPDEESEKTPGSDSAKKSNATDKSKKKDEVAGCSVSRAGTGGPSAPPVSLGLGILGMLALRGRRRRA